jgi:hypothetical protein
MFVDGKENVIGISYLNYIAFLFNRCVSQDLGNLVSN